MVRTQIQLTEAQARKVKQLARKKKVSMASVIRESLDRVLSEETLPDASAIRVRAIEAAGAFRSNESDISSRHDDYLEEAFSE